jgi:hypothetical protein
VSIGYPIERDQEAHRTIDDRQESATIVEMVDVLGSQDCRPGR